MYKTLKVVNYRGSNIYIRHLEGRRFEVLVVFQRKIYAHQIFIQKDGRVDKRMSVAQIQDSAIDQCLRASIQMVDNFKRELTIRRKVGNLIKLKSKQLYGKAREWKERIRQHASVSKEQ